MILATPPLVRLNAILTLGLSALFIPPGLVSSEPPIGGTISGRVVTAEGDPVNRARVWIGDLGPRKAETLTDADGRFRLGPVEPISRLGLPVYFQADGFAPGYVTGEGLSICPGRNSEVGILRLDRGREFLGQVLDASGLPCPDASVECHLSRNIQGHTVVRIGQPAVLKTDKDGRFRTPPVGVGKFVAAVNHPGRQLAVVARRSGPGVEETLEPIRLVPDVPIAGSVTDGNDRPLAGVRVSARGRDAISDGGGGFTLRGFGVNPRFQLRAQKDGYLPINWSVRISEQGIFRAVVPGDMKESGPYKQLTVPMEPVAWIEGRAVDDETGEPVRLDQVVICYFRRKPDGEVVLSGCRNPVFEQRSPGSFRVSYATPDEYHLTLSAPGYHDAEAFTPKVDSLKTVGGIVVRLRRSIDGSRSRLSTQKIIGKATRDGRPVANGWAGLWSLPKPRNAANAPVTRGRLVESDPTIHASALITDGGFELKVPYQGDSWYVVVEEPGFTLTQVGPVTVALDEVKKLDIACVQGGSIRGRVKGAPAGWEGQLWAVAFGKAGVRAEARVLPDATFSFANLPPGEYGLKVGYDGYDDREVYPGPAAPPKAFKEQANAWLRAKIVMVKPAVDAKEIEVDYLNQ